MEGRLLLVDDDPGVLDLLNEYFAGQGYDVEVATSGEVALSASSCSTSACPVSTASRSCATCADRTQRCRRACFAGQGDAVRGALGELRLLLKLAVELGDLPAAGRDAVAAALERVGGGAPAA